MMGFSLEEFVQLRPYLYHLTDTCNIQRILALGELTPANGLLCAGGSNDLLNKKRNKTVSIRINGDTVYIRDQKPLFEKNIEFVDGWSFERFIKHLNQHVFLWPEYGWNKPGWRHWTRYKSEQPIILRLSSDVLLAPQNRKRVRFCRFNSGSPRCRNGQKSPRGKKTFVNSEDAEFTRSKAVEVVLKGPLILNGKIWAGKNPDGPWKPVHSNAT